MKKPPLFLTLAEVVDIHLDQAERYGGGRGVRDIGLLESAVAMPQQTFRGKFLHQNIFEMAGAYAYHICSNHPFIDGNKRTALSAALTFLAMNDVAVEYPKGTLHEATLNLAEDKLTKAQFSQILKTLRHRK